MSARVEVRALSRSFGGRRVLSDVSFEIASGTTTTLVGPSGSGKTTLLRCLAGLLDPEDGTVLFDGKDVTGLPPEKRRVGIVFQSYALFPHLTVADNIGFGLAVRRVARSVQEERVRELAGLLQLEPLLSRLPAQISGGERQRVAVGRALAYRPALLLLDEPLAALDPNLAASVRDVLVDAIARERATVLFVTHDRSDALRLGDRVAVMRAGAIEQIGTPREIYAAPRTEYVASFFGPGAVWDVEGVRNGSGVAFETPLGRIGLPGAPGGKVRLVVRPEAIRPAGPGGRVATVISAFYEGDRYRVRLGLGEGGGEAMADWPANSPVWPGDCIAVRLEPALLVVVPRAEGK